MSEKENHIEEADIVIDFRGGKDAAGMYRARIQQLQAELAKANEIETDLNNSIGFLNEGIAQWKAENERLRDEIQAARQWQTCPECNKVFATQS